MKCPQCGSRTQVRNSRTAESKSGGRRARVEVSWYTRDWVARRRVCCSCSWQDQTIEILLDDLAAGWVPRSQVLPSRFVRGLAAIDPDKLTLTEALKLLRKLKGLQ